MRYRLLLTNTVNGEEAEIVVPSYLPLEELSHKIKLELDLPLCDNGWHRFQSLGTVYVIDEHLLAETEWLTKCNLYVGRYRSSERIRLKHVFTGIGSAITYIQDDENFFYIFKIRVTLVKRC